MWVLQGAVKMVWSLPEVMRVACTFMLVMLLCLALWSFGAAGVVASSMRDGGRWWLLVIRGFRSKIGNSVCCCAVLIFLFYLVETLVRFFNKYAYVQVESSVSAPTDGQNTRGLTMAQAPSDMVWHLSHFHTKL